MKDLKNVPSIRFSGFNEPWEQRKVTDICSISTGKSNTQDRIDNGSYPFYVRSPIIERSNRYLFDEEAVLTVGDGVGTGKVYHYVNGKYDLHQRVYRMFGFNKGMTVKYFYHYFSNHFDKRVMAMTAKTSVDSVRYEMISEMSIYHPLIKEQNLVSGMFDNIDNLITLHQRKLIKLKNLKKGLLEKMFPQDGENVPNLRFKNFTDPWEKRKLGELGKATSGTSIESEFTDNGKYRVISIGSYSETSTYNDQGIRVANTDKIQNRILNKKDLTMILNDKTSSGNIIGRVLMIDTDNKYVYNQRTERIEVFQNKYDSKFLYHLLNADNVRKKIIKSSQGNTQIYVNWTAICKLRYIIPNSKFEQIKIGILYNNLDNLITLHQRKLDKLENIKKSLLDKMFV